jgi:very-short-patch-repair endonuclease
MGEEMLVLMARIQTARRLRRNMTDAEALLWARLRNRQLRGMKFRRQLPLVGFVADFAAEEAKLVIEVDGGQHNDHKDASRSAVIVSAGYTVLRFWNHDVLKDIDSVLAEIDRTLALALTKSPARA